MRGPLLSVEDLAVSFETDRGTLRAVDGVDLAVARGETVCLVGESGSGKTVTCEAATGLLEGGETDGEVVFDGEDLLRAEESRLRELWGDRIGFVFQDADESLDPVYTVGDQLAEQVAEHGDVSGAHARERAVELLRQVDVPAPASRADDYPHELSGGMRQRVVVALALAGDPDLLVLDEPTTGLDVTTQADLLGLLGDLQASRDLAVVFVTHDLGVVARIADRVVVLYAGRVMERGGVTDVFERPAHPYTSALLASLPGTGRMRAIGGSLPDPTDQPAGCRFHPRCPHAEPECRSDPHPPEYAVASGERKASDGSHTAACVFHGQGRDASVVTGSGVGTDGDVTEVSGDE